MRSLVLVICFLSISFFSCNDSKNSEKQDEESVAEEQNVHADEGEKIILFFGNSLTAGYGLDITEAFPSLISNKLDSLNLDYEVVNAGNSGETTSGGLNRVEWILKQDVDIFVLELGANDGLRGIPLKETRENLQSIIDIVKSKNPDTEIILAGMQLPPNMGPEYTSGFKKIFPDLAEANNIKLVPFLLEGVGGIPGLNQGDGIHPTAEGHEILADNVWNVLKEIIQ
ncbi:acyl-CoA thioesterase-1 [Flavobacteriaceae bacterium MAR_2010_188]|nr:acyl-CoA thioesterase-1 [Flavobacteriaceae bacterium MAR_2010_188]